MKKASKFKVDSKISKVLFEEALKARSNSYSPYSKFKVGAAFLGEDGIIYSGCNVENASYGGTICAERTAILKAVSEGAKSFRAALVMAKSEGNHVVPPCGLCLQVMSEFCEPSMPVYLSSPSKILKMYSVAELLPKQFNSRFLK